MATKMQQQQQQQEEEAANADKEEYKKISAEISNLLRIYSTNNNNCSHFDFLAWVLEKLSQTQSNFEMVEKVLMRRSNFISHFF